MCENINKILPNKVHPFLGSILFFTSQESIFLPQICHFSTIRTISITGNMDWYVKWEYFVDPSLYGHTLWLIFRATGIILCHSLSRVRATGPGSNANDETKKCTQLKNEEIELVKNKINSIRKEAYGDESEAPSAVAVKDGAENQVHEFRPRTIRRVLRLLSYAQFSS